MNTATIPTARPTQLSERRTSSLMFASPRIERRPGPPTPIGEGVARIALHSRPILKSLFRRVYRTGRQYLHPPRDSSVPPCKPLRPPCRVSLLCGRRGPADGLRRTDEKNKSSCSNV